MEDEDIDAIQDQLDFLENISGQIQPLEFYDSTPLPSHLIKPDYQDDYPYNLPDLTLEL